MPNVTIIGANGNMGTRYRLILERFHPDARVFTFDANDAVGKIVHAARHSDKVIIATPTKSHIAVLKVLCESLDRPIDILCEKPVVTSESDFQKLVALEKKANIYMVNNYAYCLMASKLEKATRYHYYNSGNDGLVWDCIQLIHMAKGNIDIDRTRPIWLCEINGNKIKREEIDITYCKMIRDFLTEKRHLWGMDDIATATDKCLNLVFKFGNNPERFFSRTNKN